MENLTQVTLVVKAANQKMADHTVECALNWTVKKLKQHLATVYPSKPVETQQKIIYSGQLLQDHLMLKDVLRQYEPNQHIHTVHLVCATSAAESTPSSSTPSPSTSATPTSGTEGLRHRTGNVSETQLPTTQPTVIPQSHGVTTPAYPMYTPEQMYWMQQTYAQYMAQYMQYYQHGVYAPLVEPTVLAQPMFNVPPVANVVAGNNIPVNPVAPAVAPIAPVRQPAAAPEIVRMNAQGGPVINDDDDEMQNRDWLDWIYIMLRFGILMCILYFYSTFGRVIATVALMLVIYLYQVGWFQIHRRHAVQQQNVVPPVARQQQQPPAREEQRAPDADESEDEGNEPDNAAAREPTASSQQQQQQQQPAQPAPLSVAWTFIISFFSSLAPQQPPPVNAN